MRSQILNPINKIGFLLLMAVAGVLLVLTPNQAKAQSTTTVDCLSCVTPTPVYGVTTWTSLQSAGIGQGAFKAVGNGKTDGSGAYGITDEAFKVMTDITFKADPNCGPSCGEQVAKLGISGLQMVGSGSVANMIGAGGTGGSEGSAVATNGSAAMSLVSAGAMFIPINMPLPAPAKAP